MANKNLFQRMLGLPQADAVNEAGGLAYRTGPKLALAQYAATGTLHSIFYTSDAEQFNELLSLCAKVDAEFIAKTALYSRTQGYMKDLPALLCAVLSKKSPEHLAMVFDRTIDTPKMLRNFVQIVRSGAVGRKSLGSLPKRLVQQWLAKRTDEQLFAGSVGQSPSLSDVIKMVHPKPRTAVRDSLYAYLIGREYALDELPPIVREFERYKKQLKDRRQTPPDVPFQMLTSLNLGRNEWIEIARNASWHTTRTNLNTFQRHGVFKDESMIQLIADRLRNESLIRKARAFPYQMLATYFASRKTAPRAIVESLHDAMEIALQNVPEMEGQVYAFPDVSGSMHTAATGNRRGATSAVRCLDVAALIASALLRKNPQTVVLPFNDRTVEIALTGRDSVMTNAEKLASIPMGGANCSAPLRYLNKRKMKGDAIVYVSDNESWLDTERRSFSGNEPTATVREWQKFKRRNPQAKMICIDIQPYSTIQAQEREDVFHVAGFSDRVFRFIADVTNGSGDKNHWIDAIESIDLGESKAA